MGALRYQNQEWLHEKYVDQEWSTTDIAKFCGVSHKTICRWLEKFEINTRDSQTSQLTGPKRRKREVARRDINAYIQSRLLTTQKSDKPTLNWGVKE